MPRYLIDPPHGHMFGFPKPFEGDLAAIDMDAWLALNGYPAKLILMYPNGQHCRVIDDPEGETSCHTSRTPIL